MTHTPELQNSVNVLMIAPPDRERDSLKLVLASNFYIGEIYQADNLSLALDLVIEKKPAFMIVSLMLPVSIILQYIRMFKVISPLSRYFVVVEKISYQQMLQYPELDCILYRGFQSDDLFMVIDKIVAEMNGKQLGEETQP